MVFISKNLPGEPLATSIAGRESDERAALGGSMPAIIDLRTEPPAYERFPRPLAAITTVALPALAAFAKCDGSDSQGGDGVCPPPAEERVCTEAGEERNREIGAQLSLGSFLDGCRGIEFVADPALGGCKQRHRGGGERCEADADPARVWLVTADK